MKHAGVRRTSRWNGRRDRALRWGPVGRVWASAVGALLVIAAGCTSVLGDDFEIIDSTTTTPTGMGGESGGEGPGLTSSGAGGLGGSGGQGLTGLTGGGGQGLTGGEGGGATTCTLGQQTGCNAGRKCSIVDPATGAVGCVIAGPYLAWTACAVDTECAVGLWCDVVEQVCRPVCHDDECGNGGSCVEALQSNAQSPIPGLSVCVANCEPDQAAPCNQVNGPVNCVRTANGWGCVASDNAATGSSCSDDAHCAPGLLCTNYHCWEWCRRGVGGTCTTGTGSDCLPLSPPEYHDGNEYGTCGIS